MKQIRVGIFFISVLILSSVFLSTSNIQSFADQPVYEETQTELLVEDGFPTMNWNLKEILSDRNKTFSNFAGKVIIFDFFATWCGPCRDAMPHLRNINDHYASEPDFQLMSFGVDLSESEALLETFANNYNMNWYVFRDTAGLSNYYGITAIPTLYIINQYKYVYYSEEGFSSEENIINIVDSLLEMEDTVAPEIEDAEISPNPISIIDSDLSITSSITDGNLRYVEYLLTLDEYIEKQSLYTPNSGNQKYDFVIDPKIIWSATQNNTETATMKISASDFTGNTTDKTLTLNIDDISDTESPEISLNFIYEIDSLLGQNFEIVATIIDDTVVTKAIAEIWIDNKLNASATMTNTILDTWSVDFFNIKVNPAQEIMIKIIAEDVSEKSTEFSEAYTVTSGTAGISIVSLIAIATLSGIVAIPLQKLKK